MSAPAILSTAGKQNPSALDPAQDLHVFGKNEVLNYLNPFARVFRLEPYPVGTIAVYLKYMSTENFDEMSKEIIDFINLNARYERDARTLKVTTTLIFRMACKDHSFIEFAVRLTKRIIENISSDIKDENVRDRSGKISYGAKLFRRYLLGIMQKDFEDGINYDLEDPEELAMRDSEPWNIEVRRQRWFGLVQLTAELFAAGLLTPKIAIEIVSALLQSSPSGKRVKSLVIFLQIAGNHLENTAKPHQKEELEAHFCTFQSLIDNSNLDPQLRFEIQELVDLRNSMAKETGI